MDSYDFVDTVGSEKANAIARYRMFTNLSKSFQFIEVFFAVALIFWSSTRLPIVFRFSGEYLVAISSYFMNQHVVFLLGNLIVAVCYVLSRRSPDSGHDSAAASGTFHGDRKVTVDAPAAKPTVQPPIATVNVTESQNQSQNRMMIRNEKVMMMKSESEVVMAETAIKKAVKQMERFQRTQSEKLKSEISTSKSRRELRRSVTVTEMSNGKLTTSGTTSFQAVERLSNEEFRVAVEAFISRQQSFLKQQSMVDNGRLGNILEGLKWDIEHSCGWCCNPEY